MHHLSSLTVIVTSVSLYFPSAPLRLFEIIFPNSWNVNSVTIVIQSIYIQILLNPCLTRRIIVRIWLVFQETIPLAEEPHQEPETEPGPEPAPDSAAQPEDDPEQETEAAVLPIEDPMESLTVTLKKGKGKRFFWFKLFLTIVNTNQKRSVLTKNR